ncbi:MAG: hypothetical protein R3F43_02535 [bacterium]
MGTDDPHPGSTPSPPSREPPSRLFAGLARFVLRFRFPLLALTFGLLGASFWAIKTRLKVDTTIEAFASTDSPSQKTLESFRDEFGGDQAFIVLVEGDVFSLEFLNRLKALHEELSKLDMDIPSLGERKADRDKRRHGEAVATPREKKKAKKAGDDGFGGGGDDFAAFGGGEDDWSDEGGGSIIEETRSLINARRTRSSAEGIEGGRVARSHALRRGAAGPEGAHPGRPDPGGERGGPRWPPRGHHGAHPVHERAGLHPGQRRGDAHRPGP